MYQAEGYGEGEFPAQRIAKFFMLRLKLEAFMQKGESGGGGVWGQWSGEGEFAP